MRTSRLHLDPALLARADEDQWALQFARIERYPYHNNRALLILTVLEIHCKTCHCIAVFDSRYS